MKLRILLIILLISNISLAQKETTSVGFAENKGQIVDQKGRKNTAVLYLLNSQGLNVQLRKGGFSYDVYEVTKAKPSAKENLRPDHVNFSKEDFFKDKTEMSFHRIDIDFLNCNKNASLKAEGKSSDYDNYYTAAHAPEGILYVHKFQKVTYENIYDKIDVVFFIPEDRSKAVEYNFIVHPGGKISDIQMKFKGAKTALSEGKIKMQVRFGIMEETLPLSWTETQGNRAAVFVKYKEIRKDVYGFSSENFGGKTLVIDPVPIRLWGTYYGGGGDETPDAIQAISQNNIMITGTTTSAGDIATVGTHQPFIYATGAGYVTKFNASGNRLWGTYYPTVCTEVQEDSNFNIYFCGSTFNVNNIATPGTHQPVKNNYSDAFVVKLNSSGIREWGTYFGGELNDNGYSIKIDSNNNVYLAGATDSETNISTPGSHKEVFRGPNYDSFIVKFDTHGNRVWSSYYGGEKPDGFYRCEISDDGFIYLLGTTGSTSGIATAGSYHPTLDSFYDGMIVKMAFNGQVVWGSYIGGEQSVLTSVMKGPILFLSGRTDKRTGVATPGTMFDTFQPGQPVIGGMNCFIIKFNVQTQQKLWGTYFMDAVRGMATNSTGDLYFSGSTAVNSGVTTPDGYMPTKGIYHKSFLVKLSTIGERMWGTYYGGDKAEQLGYVAVDALDDIYLYGKTNGSTSGIATAGAHQTTLTSNPDSFIVKFRDCLSTTTASSNSPICLNGDIRLTASGGTNYLWNGPNGFTSTLQNPVILNASLLNSGAYTCSITGSAGCDNIINVDVSVGDIIAPVPDLTTLPTITGNCNSITIPTPTATDNCSGAVNGTTTSPLTYSSVGTYTIVWNYRDANNNIANQNQTVIISPEPLPVVSASPFFCQNATLFLNQFINLGDIAITGQNIKWYDSLTGGNLLPLTTILYNGTTYYASQTINGCESARVAVSPTIQETLPPFGFAVQHFCDTQTLTLSDFVVTGTNVVFYDQRVGGNILPFSTRLVDSTVYWASQTVNGCESYTRLPMIPDIMNGIPANDFQTSLCDDLNDGRETVDLSIYNADLIVNPSAYAFSYYSSFNGATIENASEKITDFQNYRLNAGENIVYVRVAFNGSCFKIATLKFNVIPSPILTMRDKFSLCENSSVTVYPDSGFQYEWSTGSHATFITLSQPGNYWVKATKNHGSFSCSTTKHFEVVLSNKATITKIDIEDWTSNNNMITVIVSGLGDYEYSIDGVHFQDSNQFYGLSSGEHTVYVNDKNGCLPASEKIYLLTYPKFFTPNNDGSNDYWKIKFSSHEPGLAVKIFDRYGKFIKVMAHNDAGWDGNLNGIPLPATDYWFVVTRANGQEHRGHFSLKR